MDEQSQKFSVSYVVTIYNKAPYLLRVLEQIGKQMGAFEREYIFVDDGSTDDSLRLLKDCTAGWKNVTIIEQRNHGAPNATNRGMFASRMQFIKLCDADDLLADRATQTLMNAMMDDPDAVLAYGKRRHYKDESEIDLSLDISGAKITKQQALKPLLRSSVATPTQVLLRTSAVHACGGCDERVRFVQDYSLLLRLSLLGHFVRLECTVSYSPHQVPGQLSENRFRELGDGQLSLAYFVADHPNLKTYLKRYACRRAGRRCWVLSRRYSSGSQPVSLRYFFLYLRSFFPVFRHHEKFIQRCSDVFRNNDRLGE